jgi:probable LLM family oxidoreductase
MELGLHTFVDLAPGQSPEQRMNDLLEEIRLADEVGLDVYGIGEHHRHEYLASAPAVILAAAAAQTKNIRLTSTVTVLSSDDPVRVFQQFATLDLLSGGRAEVMVGRGSFIESFPLFGYDLNNYDTLFSEKLDLMLALRKGNPVTWSGRTRAAIEGLDVYPQPLQNPLPMWIAVGETPQSAYRAGALGLPMALAIIGGEPARFTPMAELHRRGAQEHGQPYPGMSINSHGLIANRSQDAADIAFGPTKRLMDTIGRERGWMPMSREQFEASRTLRGANFVGSPQETIDKILYQHSLFGHGRFLLQMGVGGVPHAAMMRSIELFGTVVAPAVKQAWSVS